MGDLSSWRLPVVAGLSVLALVVVLARGTLQPTQAVQHQRAAEAQRVTITVQTIPTHATIRIDDGDALSSPHTLDVAPSRALHKLSASAPNFTTVTRQVSFDQSRLMVIRIASMYNVGRMLERRDFKERFDSGKQIALHEFLYPLIQGYESVVMRRDVELGGHDQIFNLNVGRHLMARYELELQIVMTVGLLVGLDGVDKMSKSKVNAIGINEPPRDMVGEVMSISDTLMAAWHPPLLGADADMSDPNRSKQALAEGIVARFHGLAAAAEVLAWWRAGRPVDEVHELRVSSGPIFQIVRDAGAATSGNDARRKIEQGGVRLGGERISDPLQSIEPGRYELEVGKKLKLRLVVEPAASEAEKACGQPRFVQRPGPRSPAAAETSPIRTRRHPNATFSSRTPARGS